MAVFRWHDAHVHVCSLKASLIHIGDNLLAAIDAALAAHVVPERSVLAVTSKVVSLCEGRVVPKGAVPDKYALVRQEADAYLPPDANPWNVHLTIKNHTLIASAGIDESNAGGDVYVLYPADIQVSAQTIWHHLRRTYGLQEVGVLITDSHVVPMRRGVVGVGLGWAGFKPYIDYVGKPDAFGKCLRVTKTNVLDALATVAVFEMGEGDEQTPFALLTQVKNKVEFLPRVLTQEEEKSAFIDVQDDIFAPLLRCGEWIWNHNDTYR